LDQIVYLGPPLPTPLSSLNGQGAPWNVNLVGELFTAAEESFNLLDSLGFEKNIYPHTKPPQSVREAFWRTLIGDRTETERPAPPSCAISFEKWVQFGRNILNTRAYLDPTAPVQPDLMRSYDTKDLFGGLISACGLNGRFCITENGYIAINKDQRVERDVICLIRGAQVPFVLRPVSSANPGSQTVGVKRRRFQLVGEAYIHGIMDGEMATWDNGDSGEESIEIV
jgi:hypothetical protein